MVLDKLVIGVEQMLASLSKKKEIELSVLDETTYAFALVEYFRQRSEFWHKVRYVFLMIAGISLCLAIPVMVAGYVIPFYFKDDIPGFGKGFLFGTEFQPHERGTLTDVPYNIFDLIVNRGAIVPFNETMLIAICLAVSGASLFFLSFASFLVFLFLFIWYRLISDTPPMTTTSGHVFRL